MIGALQAGFILMCCVTSSNTEAQRLELYSIESSRHSLLAAAHAPMNFMQQPKIYPSQTSIPPFLFLTKASAIAFCMAIVTTRSLLPLLKNRSAHVLIG